MGRVHPIVTDCIRAGLLLGLLCGGDLCKLSVVCRPVCSIREAKFVAVKL